MPEQSAAADRVRGVLFLSFAAWLCFAGIAVGGGIFRVLWLEPRLGEHPANLLETLALVAVFWALMLLSVPWLVPSLQRRALLVLGAFWFTLTIAFEFLFGHFVDGAPWTVLLENYDVTEGRLWILVPLSLGIGPLLIGGLLARRRHPHHSIA